MGREGTIQAIAEQLVLTLGAERCSVRVPHGKKLRLIAVYGIDKGARPKEIDFDESTIAGKAIITKQIIHITDITNITEEPLYDLSYLEKDCPKALLAVPLLFEDLPYGVAQIYRQEPFSPLHIGLANTLAEFAALTLYHIEVSKMSRLAILDIVESVFDCSSIEEAFMKTVEKVSQRLEVPSCLIYQISRQKEELMCKIVAGVPSGVHEIERIEPLKRQPHLAYAIEKKQIVTFDEDQLFHDKLTEHLVDIIRRRQIKGLLLAPVALDGVIVMEATGERENFSAEEKSFCLDVSKIVAHLFERDRSHIKEIEDQVLNPTESMAGLATRSFESILQIRENASRVCIHQKENCSVAESMCESAESLLPSTVRITTEGKKIVSSLHRIRNTRLI